MGQVILGIGVVFGIYSMLASSLNLIAGYTGILSMAHAAFLGVGAYTIALLAVRFGCSAIVSMAFAAFFGGACGLLVGLLARRIRGDQFVIATFAFQVVAYYVFNNLTFVTGGAEGFTTIPPIKVLGVAVPSGWPFTLVVCLFCVTSLMIIRRIVISPYGRILKAIREDELFASSAGKNVSGHKIAVLVIGASIAALAGGLLAHYVTYVDPTNFTVMESILILSMVVIGGAGSLWGPVAGALLLVLMPEVMRHLGLPNAIAANLRQLFYGSALLACMALRPQGLFGEYTFSKEDSRL